MPANMSEAPRVDSKYARGVLAEEIKFRRDRRQQIFSWGSSLLIAIIGGSTALASRTQPQIPAPQRDGLYAAIVIVGMYSAAWITYHYYKERKFRTACKEYDAKLGLPEGLQDMWYLDLTNLLALAGLAVAAGFAVRYNLGS